MKLILLFTLYFIQIKAFGAPCNGAPGRFHVNPDGSQGGFVQRTAWVAKETFIDTSSEVCDKTIIRGNVHIEAGSRIRENVIIEGTAVILDSHIHGFAKIRGRVVVQNSDICQASIIEGIKVINSNYYCQTEDPQPKDPGEAGKKTLLGVDSDGDGVRDDVEIFININLPNTPKKNNAQERIATKLYAKMLQKELILQTHSSSIKEIHQLKMDLANCYELNISKDVFAEMFNTYERMDSMFKAVGVMHGEKMATPVKKCKSIDAFNDALKSLSEYSRR